MSVLFRCVLAAPMSDSASRLFEWKDNILYNQEGRAVLRDFADVAEIEEWFYLAGLAIIERTDR